MMWVAAAGPASNLVMAVGWALLYKLAEMVGPGEYGTPLELMCAAGIEVNVVLMLLNLLPILRWTGAVSWRACCPRACPSSMRVPSPSASRSCCC
jgi:Zn-dependent protease